ncbi:MAG: leucine--tRNA ligase, partial [Patescibacteria group bacterium]
MSYDHKNIDEKWQKRWKDSGVFEAKNGSKKEKYYVLVEFPYPSGAGLHVGHPRSYTALDIVARKKRMEGKNVLFPMGWDAFGLPAENYAIKTGNHPGTFTQKNIDTFRKQLQSLGFSFDWSREVNTTDPAYYKWTQWMFLELFKAGLAYKTELAINWCPKDLCGLANEEVVGGACERCGTPVEKKMKSQWMIAITKYADRLLADLDTVNYLPKIKKQQEEWIGRSEGAEIDFTIDGTSEKITVFTTRPDTIFGATYLVLAPEHPLVSSIVSDDQRTAVDAYIVEAKKKTDIERGDDSKVKTGVFTGAFAINPANNEKVPVWIADYVLAHYGTGAVMAVPAHDERDFDFAKKFDLPIVQVVMPLAIDEKNPPRKDKKTVTRRMVHGIILDPKTKKILCLKWKKQPWTSFVIGGAEEGEDIIEAVKREIYEETGYKNLVLKKVLGGIVQSEYFAAHKDENRLGYTTAVYFELANDERDEMSAEEQEKHEVIWQDWKDISRSTMTCSEVDFWRERIDSDNHAYVGEGIMMNSNIFDGKSSEEVKKSILEFVHGRVVTKYKLRDWVFSRQRYWGEPIPLVHCENGCAPEKDGWIAVPVEELPVLLPTVENYQPTENGESPLAKIDSFVNTKCPQCGGPAKRETDTMPNWAGSSWYFLRYIDPKNENEFASKEALKYWMP